MERKSQIGNQLDCVSVSISGDSMFATDHFSCLFAGHWTMSLYVPNIFLDYQKSNLDLDILLFIQ